MKYLLDTHAVLWLLEGNANLGQRARRAMSRAARQDLGISDLTLLEIALLGRKGVVELKPSNTLALGLIEEQFAVFPVTAAIAEEAVTLSLPHRDPFDRVITATARVHKLTLISKDRRIVESKLVATLW